MALTAAIKSMKNSYFRRTLTTNPHLHNVKTAGVLIIGDEILKGEVPDTNSTYITKEFHKLGVKLKKICVVGDEIDEICDEVKLFSRHYDYVITTGGIGPTHDDVTFEAVSKAFGEPLVIHPDLRRICERFYKTTDVNHPGMKLAMVPQSARLLYGEDAKYPNVSIKNVYMFPGIPELFIKSFTSLASTLFNTGTIFYSKCIYINLTEDKISQSLTQLAMEYPQVQFGSYPKLFHKVYTVKITVESIDETAVKEASDKLLKTLPPESVVEVI